MTPRDVVIVGAGLNGLVAAAYLAKAGLKPLVLEARSTPGGTSVTEEFHPGFRGPVLAHASGPLRETIATDLDLARHGLRLLQPDPYLVVPSLDGDALALFRNFAHTAAHLTAMSAADARLWPIFGQSFTRAAAVVGGLLPVAPPTATELTAGNIWQLLGAGRAFRSLGKSAGYQLLRWVTMPAADLAGEWFEHELLRAAIAAPAIVGAFAGPRSPGTGALMLLHAALDGQAGGPATVYAGGAAALTRALAAAAIAAGAEIRTGQAVARVEMKQGRVGTVVLANGDAVAARTVVSSADPKRTFLRLVDPGELDPAFLDQVKQYRCRGVTATVNLALSGLPRFPAIERRRPAEAPGGDAAWLSGRIQIGPSLNYLERAFDAAKYGEYSEEPYLDVTIPSLHDPSLAPTGGHVMSVSAQFAPYHLKEGNWDDQRDRFGDLVVQTLAAYSPRLTSLIAGRQVITPIDLETGFGMTGGHIFHGEPALDQLFAMRPFYGWARYRTPLPGLYLCGAGTHPGVGMSGDSGANAAREIVRDLKKR